MNSITMNTKKKKKKKDGKQKKNNARRPEAMEKRLHNIILYVELNWTTDLTRLSHSNMVF